MRQGIGETLIQEKAPIVWRLPDLCTRTDWEVMGEMGGKRGA